MSRDPWLRALVILGVMLASLGLIYVLWQIAIAFSDIVLLFFLAWVLAFVIEPSAEPLITHARFPRPAAIGLVYLGVLVLLIIGALFVTPLLVTQLVQLVNYLPGFVSQLYEIQLGWVAELARRGVRVNLENAIRSEDLTSRVETLVSLLLSNAVTLASSIANLVFQCVLMIIISFYLALDGRRFADQFVRALPTRFQDDGVHLVESIRKAFAGFLRGNVIMAIVYAIGTAIILAIAGLPYILLASLLAGVAAVIPFVGAMLALAVPLVIVYIAQSSSGVVVIVASIVLQQVVYNVVGPRVMSQTVGLHPLLMFLVLLVGTRIAGAWGAVFSVPVAAAIMAMVEFYRLSFANHRATESLAIAAPPEPTPDAASQETKISC